jgi:hypothetical protein
MRTSKNRLARKTVLELWHLVRLMGKEWTGRVKVSGGILYDITVIFPVVPSFSFGRDRCGSRTSAVGSWDCLLVDLFANAPFHILVLEKFSWHPL